MDIRKGNSIINKAQVFVALAIIFMDIFCWGGDSLLDVSKSLSNQRCEAGLDKTKEPKRTCIQTQFTGVGGGT